MIGNLPNWEMLLLSTLLDLSPKGSDSVYISMQQVETANRTVNEINHRAFKGSGTRFQNGDTLLARITPCLENGKTAYVDFLDEAEVGHGSTEFIVITGIEGVSDDLFVYYLARYPEFRNYAIVRMEGSSGRQRVPAPTLKKYTFACPSYHEQHAISHILGSLDDKIELNRRMNEALEATARAIFKSWFVDFDPVRVKAEGGDPGLPDDVAALFPDSFEDSELGKIPRGWKRTTLKDGIRIFDSKRIPLNKRQRSERQGSFPYYGAAGIMDYVDDYLFDGVYVLTGEDGSVADENGYPVVQYVWGQFWVNNHAHVLKGTNGISDEYLFLFLKHTNISAFVTGAVQPKLSQTNLKAIPFILPDESIGSAFSELAKPLFEKLRAGADENHSLASMRDTLLPKLISGELRVPDAEKFVEESGV